MTYLRAHSRPKDKRTRIIYTTLSIVVALIVCIHFMFPHLFPALFTSLFKPFWQFNASVNTGSLDSRESLLNENARLNILLQEYEVRLNTISAIEAENELLKSLFGRTVHTTSDATTTSSSTDSTLHDYTSIRERARNRILSAVLMRPPLVGYDEYIIDIGTNYGVKVGDKVYAPGDVLIGYISDILDTTSKVALYSSPGQKYEVAIGPDNNIATALGRGGGQYEATVSRDAMIKDGDFVMSPSISDRPFGVVTAVLSDPAEPFEKILFASSVNIYNIRWVMVDVSHI